VHRKDTIVKFIEKYHCKWIHDDDDDDDVDDDVDSNQNIHNNY
jgi:hypothetical protein